MDGNRPRGTFHEKKYDLEEQIYLSLLKDYPEDKKLEFRVSVALSNCYFRMNRMEESQEWLEKAECQIQKS